MKGLLDWIECRMLHHRRVGKHGFDVIQRLSPPEVVRLELAIVH
jgi:hypothetical protein